jgi:hypothetical protein
MLPMVATEKMWQLQTGDVRAVYRGDKVTFHPTPMARTQAALLQASLELYKSIEAQAAKWKPEMASMPDDDGCSPRWSFYCHAVHAGIETALSRHSRVIVVTQPYLEEPLHHAQQDELRGMLARRYRSDARVKYVNLGDALSVRDPGMCWDGMHLTPTGNALIGRALAPEVLAMTTPG